MSFLKKLQLLCAAIFIVGTSHSLAEVQTVTLKWTAGLCKESCVKGLTQQFQKIDGVADISIDMDQGQAELQWKPDVAFSYYPVKIAMQMIGLYINNIKVKVRGTITHDTQSVQLVSLGDNTIFQLLNPVAPQKDQYFEQYSIYSRQLSQELRDKLLDIEQNNQVVTIDGPLFEPERSPPIYLVVEHMDVAKAGSEKSGSR